MRLAPIAAAAAAACLVLLAGAAGARAQTSPDLLARGQYLTRAADCAACHTVTGHAEFTGGRPFVLPMGTLYAPNITPDKETGIGDYSDEEWLKMLQQGVARDGKHLYPAMPYASYTRLSREDALAIKAYLMSLPPVRAPSPANRMKFPYDQRWLMALWNLVNNPDKRWQPDREKPAEWNRGAYLVEALGHCQECHTPRNVTLAVDRGKAFAGALTQGWMAYNLTSDKQAGLGGWSDEALAQYLSTGRADGHGPASGPMAEAVSYSLRYLTPDDIRAMVAYLRSVPAKPDGPRAPPAEVSPAGGRGEGGGGLGAQVFVTACAGCHLPDGGGRQSPWAALKGAHSTGDPQGVNIVQVLAHGTELETSDGLMFMHSFTGGYSDQELAAVANYLIGEASGSPGQVTPKQIQAARSPDAHRDTEAPPSR